MTTTRYDTAAIRGDDNLPVIHITRDFRASPAQLMRAHLDPEVFSRWNGPDYLRTNIVEWDVRTGGSWRYLAEGEGETHGFHGCFHAVGDDTVVQTFTWEGMPDEVSLERLWFEDLGDGTTRLHARSLFESFENRDGMLAAMGQGVDDGYAKLDRILAEGEV